MNKILQTRIPSAAFFLIIWFIVLASLFFNVEKSQIKWVAITGLALYLVAKIGQLFAAGKENIYDFFTIFAKSGALIGAGGIVLKALLIIRQKDVYAFGNHLQNTAAVTWGIFSIFFALALAVYIIRHVD